MPHSALPNGTAVDTYACNLNGLLTFSVSRRL